MRTLKVNSEVKIQIIQYYAKLLSVVSVILVLTGNIETSLRVIATFFLAWVLGSIIVWKSDIKPVFYFFVYVFVFIFLGILLMAANDLIKSH